MTLQLISGCGLALLILNFLHVLAALGTLILASILTCVLLVKPIFVARTKVPYPEGKIASEMPTEVAVIERNNP